VTKIPAFLARAIFQKNIKHSYIDGSFIEKSNGKNLRFQALVVPDIFQFKVESWGKMSEAYNHNQSHETSK